MNRYFVIYKPYQVLCQFSSQDDKLTLASLGDFPKDVYPVGRLDYDSEGLIILTNDTQLNNALLNPKNKHERDYLVQVENIPPAEGIDKLQKGVNINIDGKTYQTSPAKAMLLEKEPVLPERNPPIRERKNIPTSWLSITLQEGKNRQVRKMTAAIGFPTLRLVRFGIEKLSVEGYKSGEQREFKKSELIKLLKL